MRKKRKQPTQAGDPPTHLLGKARRAKLPGPGGVRKAAGTRPAPAAWERRPCAAGGQPEAFEGARAGAGTKTPAARGGGGETPRKLSPAGDAKPASSLTCRTLAPRPEARGPPGRFPSRGTQPLPPPPPPEPQDPRVEDGTGAGKAATGPESRDAYIRGTGKAPPCFAFLTGSRQRLPGTASRQPRPAAPGP
jgi:hypothetical protein|uniref:Basic proline-rich protein-like n=1 Tax=Castor canadensis TaxID=51338 RepID=A0A8B7U3K6_CASCN|nr:basic proline-rich protein-like [Castor canadensis]